MFSAHFSSLSSYRNTQEAGILFTTPSLLSSANLLIVHSSLLSSLLIKMLNDVAVGVDF